MRDTLRKSRPHGWRRKWQPNLVFLPGESQGWGSLVGCRLWGCTELDTTEQLHFHFSLSCIGEGNGNPLQCSCLENLRDGGAWWAAVYGVAQSWTRLKQPSSSSSRPHGEKWERMPKRPKYGDKYWIIFCEKNFAKQTKCRILRG